MQPCGLDVENQIRSLYYSLNGKDRRGHAAVEAEKIGRGGVGYIADLFDCHRDTIRQGRIDLNSLPVGQAEGRIQKKGRPQKCLQKPAGRRPSDRS